MTALSIFSAAFNNDVDAIEAAVRSGGANPNAVHPRSGLTPLQIACQANAADAVAALLRLDASPSLATTRLSRVDGRMFVDHAPLMYAQSLQVAQALVDAGADLEATNGEGWTPLVYAANNYCYDVFRYLVEKGASVAVRFHFDHREVSLFEFLRDKRAFLIKHSLCNVQTQANARASIEQLDKMERLLTDGD